MADDPFAGYKPPSQAQGTDPFAGYSGPASPASSYDPTWKPTGNALWDFMSRPIAKTEDPITAARDYGNTIADAATFGGADRLQSLMTGEDVNAIRTRTAASQANLGPVMGTAAQGLGYVAGPGMLGVTGRLGGGVLGAATEGVLAGAGGAAGHDQNIATGALEGGGVGLAGGVGSKILGAIAGKLGFAGVPGNAADITKATEKAKTDAYDKLQDTMYKPADVVTGLQNAGNEIATMDPGGDLARAAPRSMSELTKLGNQVATNPTTTANGILTSIQNLDKVQGPMGGGENAVAPVIQKHLQNVLDNVTPVSTTPTGVTADLAAASAANKASKNASDLQQWSQRLKGFGTSPAGPAQDVAESFYNDPNSPQYQALSKIANTAGGVPNTYGFVHGVVHPLIEGAAFATLPPGLAPGVAALGTFLGAKPALNAALGARSRAATQNAIADAYPTLTGQRLVPPTPPDAGQALRALMFGKAASNFQ
jgi:hypothetical protein